MAKLTLPTTAYKVTNGSGGKWHLPSANQHHGLDIRTSCGHLIWSQAAVDTLNERNHIEFEPTENKPISEIPAKDLCSKCLGAIKAED